MSYSDGRPGRARSPTEPEREISDRAWSGVERLLERLDPPLRTGRPRTNPRRTLNGILYRERTRCRWREVPRKYGDDATLHRTFRRWTSLGVLDRVRDVIAEAGGDGEDHIERDSVSDRPASIRRPRRKHGSNDPR